MSKEGVIERDGQIIEMLPAGFFKVQLKEVGTFVRAKKSGKMSQAHISIIPGDRVKLELNQYDMNQGRIVYRYNANDAQQIVNQ
jgi:translation initiation factor IF-1